MESNLSQAVECSVTVNESLIVIAIRQVKYLARAFYLVLNRSTQNKGFTGNKEIDIHVKTSRQTKYPINKIKFSSGSHVSVTRVRNRIQLSDPASPSGNGL